MGTVLFFENDQDVGVIMHCHKIMSSISKIRGAVSSDNVIQDEHISLSLGETRSF